MLLVVIYLSALVVANLTVAHFGPAVSPLNALVLIGLDLSLRDRLHDRWQDDYLWVRMVGIICAAGAISYALNPAAGTVAVASVTAFVAAGLVDAGVYHRLRGRPFLARSNGSNVASAAVDSVLFPTIAFGAILPHIVLLQFVAKVAGGFLWSLVLQPAKETQA